MAVGTVSSIADETWQLIGTNTASAATTSTFSSISGYKKLMLIFSGNRTDAESFWMRFNGDTTGANYGGAVQLYYNYGTWNSSNAFIPLLGYVDGSTTATVACAVIDYANVDTPKLIDITGSRTSVGNGVYLGNAITSILVSTNAGTFTGTLKLYGIAA